MRPGYATVMPAFACIHDFGEERYVPRKSQIPRCRARMTAGSGEPSVTNEEACP
jgi:hypothetical protein